METLPITNPFPGAGSFLVRETTSTQDEAKRLTRLGLPSGSLVAAESQSSGRGRFAERRWESAAGVNLLFSLRLDPSMAQIPALPLRIGAALCRAAAIEAIRSGIDLGADGPRLKWPNDLLFSDRKAAGILCEACSDGVYAGIGVNCNQLSFPEGLREKATSLELELGFEIDRWVFLEIFLGVLKTELEEKEWQGGVEELLWHRGEIVSFLPGLPGACEVVRGRLEGIDSSGSLLVRPSGEHSGTAAANTVAFAAGELLIGAHP